MNVGDIPIGCCAVQMYNKQKEIEALEKRQALSKSLTDEDLSASADGSAAQHGQGQGAASAAAKAAANGGLYRGSTPASSSAAPADPAAEVLCSPHQHQVPLGVLVHCRPTEILLTVGLGAMSEQGCAGIRGPLPWMRTEHWAI